MCQTLVSRIKKLLCKNETAFKFYANKFVSNVASKEMIVLNVAEKNDAAKNISNILSAGTSRRREGFSKYNKIYEFNCTLNNLGPCQMIMTSVSGHLFNYDFDANHRKWYSCDPEALFDARVEKMVTENFKNIKLTLEREARRCSALIIWTDCDREGENIGFEIIQVCKSVRRQLNVFRAQFSEMTPQAIKRAVNNLSFPDKKVSDAVDVRQQLDLRIGAAFTRFQTLGLQNMLPPAGDDKQVISYGSCQFPTLGFVVERHKQRVNFVPQTFYYISLSHKKDGLVADFSWIRQRLFDEQACLAIMCKVMESPEAQVTSIKNKRKTKWRPQPMDTVTFERLASSKLKINAKKAMDLAEKLYTRGIISYPRTETNIFPKDLNLAHYVSLQVESPSWGQFAQRVLNNGPNPRQGNKSDQAHPPIYPTKYADNLLPDEKRIYELIARHFLACLSSDAVGSEINIKIVVNEENFTLSGLRIDERNFLEVYPYEKWTDKEIPRFEANERFIPTSIMMNDGQTTAPELLTEAQLIALMEKHGIGTDATHAEHIEKIKERKYIIETRDRRLSPEGLGIGLVDGYDIIGYEMSKPHLRAALERDLKAICEGSKRPDEVLQNQINQYKRVYVGSVTNKQRLFDVVKRCLSENININNT